jgi:hypothetical protein
VATAVHQVAVEVAEATLEHQAPLVQVMVEMLVTLLAVLLELELLVQEAQAQVVEQAY